MNRLSIVTLRLLIPCFSLAVGAAVAQDRPAALDKAHDEARAAYSALQQAEARRDQDVESEPGNQSARQTILEQDVEQARKRYAAAMKRWNDLK